MIHDFTIKLIGLILSRLLSSGTDEFLTLQSTEVAQASQAHQSHAMAGMLFSIPVMHYNAI